MEAEDGRRQTAKPPYREPTMPVIVVGADTEIGLASIEGLLARQGEVRAFVTDPEVGASLRERRVKVALGDVSDPSHIEAAALSLLFRRPRRASRPRRPRAVVRLDTRAR